MGCSALYAYQPKPGPGSIAGSLTVIGNSYVLAAKRSIASFNLRSRAERRGNREAAVTGGFETRRYKNRRCRFTIY